MLLLLQVLILCYEEEEESDVGLILGIDFGTTYSCAGVFRKRKVEIIPNEFGNYITPSIVSFIEGQPIVGDSAIPQMISNPKNTIFGIKRLIGRHFNDSEVQSEIKHLPYKVVDKNNLPYIEIEIKNEVKTFSPEEIFSMILSKLKKEAENYFGQTIKHAAVTIPTYFKDDQIKAIKNAGSIAELTIFWLSKEPHMAAIALCSP